MNQKGLSPIFIVLILVFILGVASGTYYLGKYSSKPQSQNTIIISEASPSPTVSSQPQSILSSINVIPINASRFKKSIVDSDNCSNPVGLVTYNSQNNNSMRINSTKLVTTEPFKSSLQSVINFINQNTPISNNMDIKDWDFAFRDYCGGAASYIFKEIKNINYPNTDKARAIAVIGGNGGIGFGEIRVYATKGDNVIFLDMNLSEEPLYKSINNACLLPNGFGSQEEAIQCIKNDAVAHAELDQDVLKKVNALINEFAI